MCLTYICTSERIFKPAGLDDTCNAFPKKLPALGRRCRRPDLKPVPEKPQRDPIVTMAPKRVLDGYGPSGRDDDDDLHHHEMNYAQDTSRLQDEEPIDVFNPVGNTVQGVRVAPERNNTARARILS